MWKGGIMVYFYNNFLLLSLWFNKAFSRMLLSLSEIFFGCSHMLKCLLLAAGKWWFLLPGEELWFDVLLDVFLWHLNSAFYEHWQWFMPQVKGFLYPALLVNAALSSNHLNHVVPDRISVFAVINTLAHSKREAPVFWKTNRLRKSFIDPFFLSSSLHPFPTQNWLCCHTAMTSRMAPLQRKQMKAYWFYSMQWHLRHQQSTRIKINWTNTLEDA